MSAKGEPIATSGTDQLLTAESLERKGATAPLTAMALVLQEPAGEQRDRLRDAVLRGWASVDADEAAAWVLSRPKTEHDGAFEAVFDGAQRQAGVAQRLARTICESNPSEVNDIGHAFAVALSNAGNYGAVLDFARDVPTASSGSWISGALYQWASQDPLAAWSRAQEIGDPDVRNAAFRSFVIGWTANAPAEVADFALHLPPGPDRTEALYQALPRWMEVDPAAAAEWVVQNSTEPGMDPGKATAAAYSKLADLRPDIAIGLAETIADHTLRLTMLHTLGGQWGQRDPAAAERFATQTPGLRPEDRAAIESGIPPR